MNLYNEKVIFVPSCLLCPVCMAKKLNQTTVWRKEIIFYLNDNGYSMFQMPCPEASFDNCNCGLSRSPHGIKFYEELVGFKDHCYKLGDHVMSQIDAFYMSGYSVFAVMGIEHSPTCAASYIYTRKGTQKRRGIFMEYLSQMIYNRGYQIPLIGINRRFPHKAIKSLLEIENAGEKEL